MFGNASSGFRWRDGAARGYSWSDWRELVREECEVDGGSKGGGIGCGKRHGVGGCGSSLGGVVWGERVGVGFITCLGLCLF